MTNVVCDRGAGIRVGGGNRSSEYRFGYRLGQCGGLPLISGAKGGDGGNAVLIGNGGNGGAGGPGGSDFLVGSGGSVGLLLGANGIAG